MFYNLGFHFDHFQRLKKRLIEFLGVSFPSVPKDKLLFYLFEAKEAALRQKKREKKTALYAAPPIVNYKERSVTRTINQPL